MQLELSAHSLLSDKEVDRITVLHSVEGFALVMLCRYTCSWVFFVVVFYFHAHREKLHLLTMQTAYKHYLQCNTLVTSLQYVATYSCSFFVTLIVLFFVKSSLQQAFFFKFANKVLLIQANVECI